jgi:hypothetical protein
LKPWAKILSPLRGKKNPKTDLNLALFNPGLNYLGPSGRKTDAKQIQKPG